MAEIALSITHEELQSALCCSGEGITLLATSHGLNKVIERTWACDKASLVGGDCLADVRESYVDLIACFRIRQGTKDLLVRGTQFGHLGYDFQYPMARGIELSF